VGPEAGARPPIEPINSEAEGAGPDHPPWPLFSVQLAVLGAVNVRLLTKTHREPGITPRTVLQAPKTLFLWRNKR
jgi:hypothetical protein